LIVSPAFDAHPATRRDSVNKQAATFTDFIVLSLKHFMISLLSVHQLRIPEFPLPIPKLRLGAEH
jgi:hypothetical protein